MNDRGRPVARLNPVPDEDGSAPDEGRLAHLEREGVVRRVRKVMLEEIARTLPPASSGEGDVVAVILDERRTGR